MRLIEAVLKANGLAGDGGGVGLAVAEHGDALPLAALTCIDARLNRLIPERLGIPEEQFVWLRNAGNIITGPLSSTVRSLALGCAVKGAKEIAVIGHTDCQVCKATMLNLTEALRHLGVDRHRLPDNIVEYFGLFASERQNVMRAAEIIRSSPLIGPRVPVHGLMMDTGTGRLEWVVNGYETLAQTASALTAAVHRVESSLMEAAASLPDLKLGEMRMPEVKIGDVQLPQIKVGGMTLPQIEISGIKLPEIRVGQTTVDPNQWLSQVKTSAELEQERPAEAQTTKGEVGPEASFDKTRRYKVIGSDQKVYGPISGMKILQWIAEGRIGWDTPSQAEGTTDWRPLNLWAEVLRRIHVPLPPRLPGSKTGEDSRRRGR